MNDHVNDPRTKTEFASVEEPLNMHRTASNETTLVSEIPSITDEENILIAPGQGKTPVSILNDGFFEEQVFPSLHPKGKFGFNAPRNTSISSAWYFKQRLRNLKQYFASDADYIFFCQDCI